MKKVRKLTAIMLCLSMLFSLAACQTAPKELTPQPEEKPSTEVETIFTSGTYEGSSKGMYGEVPVTVTASESRIESIVVGENKETRGLGDVAALEMTSRIIKEQSLAVDMVSGATITSLAVINAVKGALQNTGVDIAVLTKAESDTPLEKGLDETVDVVIVGAGLAGLNAAYDLKVKSPEVSFILLEKRDVITGSLPLSGGSLLATNSKLHDSMGYESDVSDIIQQMEAAAGEPVREDLITAVFSNSEEIFNRILEWGVPLYSEDNYYNPYVKTNPVVSNPRVNNKVHTYFPNGSGGGYATFWYDHIAKDPIDLRIHSNVTDLIVSDGVVTGVKVQDREKEYEIHAKAVLLATGGFGSNPEYVKKYSPNYVGGISRSNSGATGDGITMTKQFNTPIVGIGLGMISGELQASFNVGPVDTTFTVTPEGNRVSRSSIVSLLTSGTEAIYTIIDSNFANKELLQKHLDAKLIEPYDSIEELAKAKGIDAVNLVAAMAANNEAVDSGQSPGFDVMEDQVVKLDSAPYYAERIYHSWSGTYPSIKIDDYMRVLDGSEQPVKGLYAAGELTTANFYYGGFPGLGVAGSLATYSGPYAARSIVEDLNQ